MVKKIEEALIENIQIDFSFNKKMLLEINSYFLDFSDQTNFISGNNEFENLEDLNKNFGLFDLEKWKITNFESQGNDAVRISLDAKNIQIYLSNKNSEKQLNFLGKVKQFINQNTKVTQNTLQVINEVTIARNSNQGEPTFWEDNQTWIKNIVIGAIGGALAYVIGDYLLHWIKSLI